MTRRAAGATPLIAIVGRPNVGKSTLYNRLVGGRPAMVHDTPGLTRDRRYGEFEYFGHEFRLVDTGGLDPEVSTEVIGAGIHRQAMLAIEQADAVVFVVDITAGVTPTDRDVAEMLRTLRQPVLVCANKADSVKRELLAGDIYALGLGEVHPVSAVHGRGVDDMLDALVQMLQLPAPVVEVEDETAVDGAEDEELASEAPDQVEWPPVRVAFVGKPNAGKSSLMNRLAGTERVLVHDQPGTTTDPVDTPFSFAGKDYVLVDTAGIRRRARIDEDTEKIAVSMALSQIERADVVVLVIDGEEGPSEQDARLAGNIDERGRGIVVALNKADLLQGVGGASALSETVRTTLRFIAHAPTVLTSALSGDGIGELLGAIDRAAEQHRRRIPTDELNRFFAEISELQPPRIYRGHSVTIHYLTQGGIRPPTFLLWTNRPEGISPSYRRFFINQLRHAYGFAGSSLRLVVKAKRRNPSRRSGKRGGRKRRRPS